MSKKNKRKGRLGLDLNGQSVMAHIEVIRLIYTEPYNQLHVRLINVQSTKYEIDSIDVHLIMPAEVLIPDSYTTRCYVLTEPYAVYDLDYEDYVIYGDRDGHRIVLADDFHKSGNYTMYDGTLNNGVQKVSKTKELIVDPNSYVGTTETINLTVIETKKLPINSSVATYELRCITDSKLEFTFNCHLTIKP